MQTVLGHLYSMYTIGLLSTELSYCLAQALGQAPPFQHFIARDLGLVYACVIAVLLLMLS